MTVLDILYREGGQTVAALAQKTGRTTQAVYSMTANLEKLGHVKKGPAKIATSSAAVWSITQAGIDDIERDKRPSKYVKRGEVLDAVWRHGVPLTAADIAEMTGIKGETCRNKIYMLVEAGHMRRVKRSDARGSPWLYFITAKGLQLAERGHKPSNSDAVVRQALRTQVNSVFNLGRM